MERSKPRSQRELYRCRTAVCLDDFPLSGRLMHVWRGAFMQSYRKRDYWEDREDTEWRIEPEALVRVDVTGRRSEWRWKDVVGVRTDVKQRQHIWRSTLSVWVEGGFSTRCEIDDLSVVTVGEYERKEDYTSFALAVLANVAAKAPRARGWVGTTKGEYVWWTLLFLGVVIAFPLALFDPSVSTQTKLLLAGAMLPGGYLVIWGRPRAVNVSALKQRIARSRKQ